MKVLVTGADGFVGTLGGSDGSVELGHSVTRGDRREAIRRTGLMLDLRSAASVQAVAATRS